jgi:hypothetical protein
VFEEGLNRSGTRDLLGRVQEELAYGQKLETHQVHRNESKKLVAVANASDLSEILTGLYI